MKRLIRRGIVGATAVVPLLLGSAGVSAIAAPLNSEWDKSNVAMNLGADSSGTYADSADERYSGEGQIVFVVDGAFTPGNPLYPSTRVAGEYCFGLAADQTAWPNLCETSNLINSSWLYKRPAYFSSLGGSSAPSPRCVTAGGDLCHNYHGTATGGAVVAQPGVRWELNADGSHTALSTAGAAPGAKTVKMKVGGGTSTGSNDHSGWSGESVVNALDWIYNVGRDQAAYRGKIAAVTLSVGGAPGNGSACTSIGQAIDAAAGRLKSAGIPVIMSAGNDASSHVGTWNCGQNVITVGATKTLQPHERATYSNFATSTRLYAPVGEGVAATRDGVLLPWKSSGTFYASGTSFAAPQVAGAFAVLREKFGSAPTVDQLVNLLANTGAHVTGPDSPPTAREINIRAALQSAP